MIDELEELIPEFSKVNHTRCFLHVINLVARTMVKQFDVRKTITGAISVDEDEEIRELAGDLDYNREERQTQEALLQESAATANNLGPEDDVEGWVDEITALSVADRADLEESIRPVKMVLVKVRNVKQIVIQFN